MRCSYCYNPDIVFLQGSISIDTLLDFLQQRKEKLEAVVLSGGEATQYAGLVELCSSIKALGFKIKLDTNGTNPDMLIKLIELKLIDYVALDYKAPKEKFYYITKNKNFDTFVTSLTYLLTCKIDYEIRTTLHSDLLDEEDINKIIRDLAAKGYQKDYYIQEVQSYSRTIGNLEAPFNTIDKRLLANTLNIVFRT